MYAMNRDKNNAADGGLSSSIFALQRDFALFALHVSRDRHAFLIYIINMVLFQNINSVSVPSVMQGSSVHNGIQNLRCRLLNVIDVFSPI